MQRPGDFGVLEGFVIENELYGAAVITVIQWAVRIYIGIHIIHAVRIHIGLTARVKQR